MIRKRPRVFALPDVPWIGVEVGWQTKYTHLAPALVCLLDEHLNRSLYIVGATGSGKSVVIVHLIAQEIMRRRSFALLDMRGDLANVALELLALCVDARLVAFLDFRERNRPLGFNPLKGAGEPYIRALGVQDVIAANADSWGVQLAETLRNALLLLALHGCALADLESLFYNAMVRRQLLEKTQDERLRGFWERYDAMSAERQATLAAPVLNKVSLLLATDGLRKVYGHHAPLDLGVHLNTRGSATIGSFAVDELHAAGRMSGALFLSSLCREVFSRVDTPESERVLIRLFVDEFENFGMAEFETILAEGRRFGLSCVIAHQTLAQVPHKTRSVILGNVGTIIAFRTSREDAAVLSRHVTGDPKALNLAELPTGVAYVCRQGHEPILTEINAPLIIDVGRMSPAARAYRQALRDQIPLSSAEPKGEAKPQSDSKKPGSDPSLEDWL